MSHPTTTSTLTSALLARHRVQPDDLPGLAGKIGIELRVRAVHNLLNGTTGLPTPSLAYAITAPLGEPLHALRPDLGPALRRNPLVEIIAGTMARGEYTARDLAQKAGIDDAWVYNALAGKILPDPVLRALCGALAVEYPPTQPYAGMRHPTQRPAEPEPTPVAPSPAEPPPPHVLQGYDVEHAQHVLDEAPPGWIPASVASIRSGHERTYARYISSLGRVPSIKVKGPTPTGYAWYVRAEDFPAKEVPEGPDLPTVLAEPEPPAAPVPSEPLAVAPAPEAPPAVQEVVEGREAEDNLLWLLIQAVSVAARNTRDGQIPDTAWQLALCLARTLKDLATVSTEIPAQQMQVISVLEGLIDPAASGKLNLGTMYSVLGNILRSRKSEDTLTAELLRGLDLALALRDERNQSYE